jgi:hypothetical protein
MSKTLEGLIEELIELRNDFNGDTPVRIAYQPTHPLVGDITHVVGVPDDETFVSDGIEREIYLGCTTDRYLSGEARNALNGQGWR